MLLMRRIIGSTPLNMDLARPGLERAIGVMLARLVHEIEPIPAC